MWIAVIVLSRPNRNRLLFSTFTRFTFTFYSFTRLFVPRLYFLLISFTQFNQSLDDLITPVFLILLHLIFFLVFSPLLVSYYSFHFYSLLYYFFAPFGLINQLFYIYIHSFPCLPILCHYLFCLHVKHGQHG